MRRIESHSSGLNNQRIITLFMEVDNLALQAGASMRFGDIQNYWNAVEQVWLNVKDVPLNQPVIDQIDKLREYYYKMQEIVVERPDCRNQKSLLYLYRLAKRFNSNLITLLQAGLEYFFRTGTRELKGLLNIPFYDTFKEEVEEEAEDDRETEASEG